MAGNDKAQSAGSGVGNIDGQNDIALVVDETPDLPSTTWDTGACAVNENLPVIELPFSVEDIRGLSVVDNDQLVFRLSDGSEFPLPSIAPGQEVILDDGTLVNAYQLVTNFLSAGALPTLDTLHTYIEIPPEGISRIYVLEPGQKYVFDFDASQVGQLEIGSKGDLVIPFDNGSQIVLKNYAQALQFNQPSTVCTGSGEIIVPANNLLTAATIAERGPNGLILVNMSAFDGNVDDEEDKEGDEKRARSEIDEAAFFGEEITGILDPTALSFATDELQRFASDDPAAGLDALAPELAALEPAAAAVGASRSGFGFGSVVENVSLDSVPAIGPLGQTALGFGLGGFSDGNGLLLGLVADDIPVLTNGPINVSVDETNLGPTTVSGNIAVDFGNDGPGTITPNGFINVDCSLLNGQFTSGGRLITINVVGNGYTAVTDTGVTVFNLALNPNNGNFTFTLFEPVDHADPNDPDDIICIDFGFTATDFDGDTLDITARINVIDDAPGPATSVVDNIDETGLGPITTTGSVNPDFGNDIPNAVSLLNFTPSGSILGPSLSSGGVPVTIVTVGNTVTGTAGTIPVFDFTIDPLTGNFTFNQFAPLDHADGTDPDDIITFTADVRITDFDGDFVDTSVTINVADDAPDPSAPASETVDETNLGPNVVAGNINPDFGVDGPSQSVDPVSVSSLTASAVGFPAIDINSLSSGGDAINVTQVGNTFTGTTAVGGQVAFVFTIDPLTGAYSFTQNLVLDHPDGTNPDDVITFTANIDVTDFDGDTASSTITIDVLDDAPVASANVVETIDETNLGPNVVAGSINPDFGEDGAGSISVSSLTASAVGFPAIDINSLSSGGDAINVTQVGNTFTGTTAVGGQVAFVFTIDPLTGAYSFTQNLVLDHPDGTNPDDIITFTANVDITDFDGDTASSTITIDVLDDAPLAVPAFVENIDETSLASGTITTTGSVSPNFGNDVPHGVSVTGFTPGGSLAGGTLTSGGVTVTLATVGNTVTGTAGAATVFDFTIDPVTGDYTFNQFLPLDHADTTDPNDVITLTADLQITDFDGDSVNTTVTVNVADDAPIAADDTVDVGPGTGSGTVTGNVLTNDTDSVDAASTLTEVIFGGTTTSVPAVGTVTVNGTAGSLDIDAAGNFTYTLFNPTNPPIANDVFTYTIVDTVATGIEGDSDQASFTLNIDHIPLLTQPVLETVDETNLASGSVVDTGTLTANFFGETPGSFSGFSGTIAGVRDFAPPAGGLRSQGDLVDVVFSGGVYTGTANTGAANERNIFTLEIQSDGDYTFTLLDALDHPDPNDPDEAIQFDFGVFATDFDGDNSVPGTITIVVEDDAPRALPAFVENVDETNFGSSISASGSISPNFGQDTPPTAVSITGFSPATNSQTSQGVPVEISISPSGTTLTGTAGSGGPTVFTLTINPITGNYTYTQVRPFDHPITSNANDTISIRADIQITDFDGDTESTTLTVNVADDGPIARNDSFALRSGSVGNLLNNDTLGADDPTRVTSFTVNGTTRSVPDGGSNTISGITVSSNGAVSYSGAVNNVNFSLSYTIRDGDGDTSSASASLRGPVVVFTPPPPPPPTFEPSDDSGGDSDPGGDPGDDGDDGDDDGDDCPLVFDLDGDGVELVELANGVEFDMGWDGVMDQTAWVDRDDGLLAFDENKDGVINDHSELFGGRGVDGFTELATHDSNNDGIIDQHDTIWSNLLMWQDQNQDGVSQAHELHLLSHFGIASIHLGATLVDYDIAGSNISHQSTFAYDDGSTGDVLDAWFNYTPIENDQSGSAASSENFVLSDFVENGDNVSDAIQSFVNTETSEGGINTGASMSSELANPLIQSNIISENIAVAQSTSGSSMGDDTIS